MTTMEKDFVIIGAGVAGMTAALYAVRAGRSVALLESAVAGGVLATLDIVENFPSRPNVYGGQIAADLKKQIEALGVTITYAQTESIDCDNTRVVTSKGEFVGRKLIIATGSAHAKLGLAHEDELVGQGISYCATCDGNFYRGLRVAVVGSGRQAAEDAAYLAPLVSQLVVVTNRPTPPPRLEQSPNLQLITSARPSKLVGKPLSAIELAHDDGTHQSIEVDGVFVATGYVPNTQLVVGQLALDKNAQIIVDAHMCSSKPNVYAIGDVRSQSPKQIIVACSDAVIAVGSALRT